MIQSRVIRLSLKARLLIGVFFVAALGSAMVNQAIAQTPPVLDPSTAQSPTPQPPVLSTTMQISWEVRNRFRLFREERDFRLQADSLNGRNILAAEETLAAQSDGRGWARNTLGRLCIDAAGRVSEPCTRDGMKESYLTPTDH
ncbi:MAG TPA: hypothetical protein VF499_04225, partial [Afipia sp.]